MFVFLCLFFPPVIALALRMKTYRDDKPISSTVTEYALWTLLVNSIVITGLSLFRGYGHYDLNAIVFTGKFTIQYITTSSAFAAILALCSIRFRCSFTVGFMKYPVQKKVRKIIMGVYQGLCGLLLAAGILAYRGTDWTYNNFGLLTIDKMLYQLYAPKQGTSLEFISSFISYCVLPAVGVAGIVVTLFNIRWKPKLEMHITGKKRRISLTLFPFIYLRRGFALLSAAAFLLGFGYFSNSFSIGEYIDHLNEYSGMIEENYVDPKTANLIFPEKPRNLIHIYMESMETTYYSTDLGGNQEKNLIPELTDIARENVFFASDDTMRGGIDVAGTGWTIGAMVAKTAGIPLKLAVDGNALGEFDSILPGAYSMGDILNREGYNQTLLVGSDANFGGRKGYFSQHGKYKILDYTTAIEDGIISPDYYVWWGYEDEKLYEYAKKELLNLAKESKPFNMTMLTVDTHHISGYVCALCEDTEDTQYANVIRCASRQAGNFISWIQEQDFYENTTIVITGDHLSMDPNFFRSEDWWMRATYNAFINAVPKQVRTTSYPFTSMDMFPTILASMGVQIEGNRLALGTNLFSGEETLYEKMGGEIFNQELNKTSLFYNKYLLNNENISEEEALE